MSFNDNRDSVISLEELSRRIAFFESCGFDHDRAVEMARFQGSDGIMFAVPDSF